jgi:hypothetical protein
MPGDDARPVCSFYVGVRRLADPFGDLPVVWKG